MSELIDIYNQDKQPTGKQVDREKNRLQPGEYMLYALALIQNDKGQFLLTQRSRDKKWAAGWWEVPGGAAKAGENSFTAMRREVWEETGIDLQTPDDKPIYSYRNDDPETGDYYFCDIYLCRQNFGASDIRLQNKETIDYQIASLEGVSILQKVNGVLHYPRLMEALKAANL